MIKKFFVAGQLYVKTEWLSRLYERLWATLTAIPFSHKIAVKREKYFWHIHANCLNHLPETRKQVLLVTIHSQVGRFAIADIYQQLEQQALDAYIRTLKKFIFPNEKK